MRKLLRGLRPSPALIVACLALFVAMGGVGYAALKLKPNSVKTKNLKNAAVTEAKIADGAVSTGKFAAGAKAPQAGTADNALHAATADNALQVGGVSPSGLQRSCKAGAIRGGVVFDTNGFTSNTFQNVPGFNCLKPGNTTTSVQVRKLATLAGVYVVRFIGNAGPNRSQSAVTSVNGLTNSVIASWTATAEMDAPGEIVFDVSVNTATGTPLENQKFSLLVF